MTSVSSFVYYVNMSNRNEDTIPPELDDEDIRRWFESRDPERKKPNPFITQETAEQWSPKPRGLTSVNSPANSAQSDQPGPPTFTEHDRHIREVARRFTYMGAAAALAVAIVLVLLL